MVATRPRDPWLPFYVPFPTERHRSRPSQPAVHPLRPVTTRFGYPCDCVQQKLVMRLSGVRFSEAAPHPACDDRSVLRGCTLGRLRLAAWLSDEAGRRRHFGAGLRKRRALWIRLRQVTCRSTAAPMRMTASPMLMTLRKGSQVGVAAMSPSQGSTGWTSTPLFLNCEGSTV